MAGPLRLRPDDDIRRIRNVWLGPTGTTFPFQASYLGWGLFASILTIELIFEWVTPLSIGFPAWEVAIAMLLSTAITGAIDYDKPLRALPGVSYQHLTTLAAQYRRRGRHSNLYKPMRRVRIRNREYM